MAVDLMRIITGYKQSVALMTGMKMNIPEILSKPRTIKELSEILKIKERSLFLFLMYWKFMGILNEENNVWYMQEEDRARLKEFDNIIKHEQNIMECWNTSQNIIESLKNSKKTFSPEDRQLYLSAMNGKNLEIIGLRMIREYRKNGPISYLEWGNSAGQMSTIIAKFYTDAKITIVVPNQFINRNDMKLAYKKIHKQVEIYSPEDLYSKVNNFYDIIHLYNTVHYCSSEELKKTLLMIKEHMNDNSLLCIADMFLKDVECENYMYLLDWITHGGTNHLYVENISEVVSQCGLQISKSIYLREITTDLIFIKRMDKSEQTN